MELEELEELVELEELMDLDKTGGAVRTGRTGGAGGTCGLLVGVNHRTLFAVELDIFFQLFLGVLTGSASVHSI